MADKTIADLTLKATPISTDKIELDDGASLHTTFADLVNGPAIPLATISKPGLVPTLPNDATKYLDGTGSYSVPAGGGGGGGSWEYLGTITFAGDTTKEITTIGDASHVQLHIRLADVKFSQDNVSFYIKVKTGGGVQASAYHWGNFRWTDGGTGNTGGAGDTKLQLADAIGNDSNESLSGNLQVETPQGATWKKISGQLNWTSFNPDQFGSVFSGSWHGTTALTGFEFSVSAGNIASGTVQIWGLKAS